MADRGPIKLDLNANHYHHDMGKSSTSIGSDNSNDLSARLGKNEADIAKLMAAVGDLSVNLKNIPTAMEAVAVAATRMSMGNKTETSADVAEKNRNNRYKEQANRAVGKVDALERHWGSDLSPEQSKILKLRDTVNSHIDAAGNFSSNTKEATQSLAQLNQSLRNINKTVGTSAQSGGINGFNVAEALTYATILSAGRYASIGTNYDIGIQGASANQLGLMTVQRDVAQRNAVSSGFSSGGSAIGAVIGGTLGPLGGILGSAIGASLGVVSSMVTSNMNASELQVLNMQQAANQAVMFGAKGGRTLVTPPTSFGDRFEKALGGDAAWLWNLETGGDFSAPLNVSPNYYVNNPLAAKYLSKGQGYNAVNANLLGATGSIYGLSDNKIKGLANVMSQYGAASNYDFSPYASSISYLASLSSGNNFANRDFSKILTSSGGNPGGLLDNISTLVQRTPMGVNQATNYASSLQPYGQAYASAGMGLQTMPVFSQLQAAAILSITNPGTTLSQIKNNPSLLRSTARHMNVSMFGENFDVFEGLRQSALGSSTAQAIDNNKITSASEIAQPSQLVTPTAVQTGMNAAGGKTTASNITIQAQNVHVMGHGNPQPMTAGQTADVQALQKQLAGLTQGYA